jgi:hypothetical protein
MSSSGNILYIDETGRVWADSEDVKMKNAYNRTAGQGF